MFNKKIFGSEDCSLDTGTINKKIKLFFLINILYLCMVLGLGHFVKSVFIGSIGIMYSVFCVYYFLFIYKYMSRDNINISTNSHDRINGYYNYCTKVNRLVNCTKLSIKYTSYALAIILFFMYYRDLYDLVQALLYRIQNGIN